MERQIEGGEAISLYGYERKEGELGRYLQVDSKVNDAQEQVRKQEKRESEGEWKSAEPGSDPVARNTRETNSARIKRNVMTSENLQHYSSVKLPSIDINTNGVGAFILLSLTGIVLVSLVTLRLLCFMKIFW